VLRQLFARNWFCCGVIALFTVLLWGPTARYQFVWDDEIYIQRNMSIRSLANIPKMFTQMSLQSAEDKPTSYRPIRNVFYAILYAIDGHATPRPYIFHLANIILEAAVAALLFLVALLLWERLEGALSPAARVASFLIALGFAAHPVATEVVCWAKSLDDLITAVFGLACIRSLLKWNGGKGQYIAALIWFLLAAFAKESGVPFALVAFLIFYGFHKFPLRRSVKLTIPFLLAAAFYVAVRQLVTGHASQCPPLSGSYGSTLVDMFPVGWNYLRLLWGIPPFCIDYNYMQYEPVYRFFSVPVLWGVLLLFFFTALAYWMWRRQEWRMAGFGLLWTALFLLPVSNLIPMMQYMADRFLYLPLIGFLLTLAGAFMNFSRLRRAAAIAAGAAVVIWAGTTMNRMQIWQDPLQLFISTEMEHPGIKRVEKNALAAIFTLPQFSDWHTGQPLTPAQADGMIDTLQKARRIYPQNDDLTTQVGMTEARVGRWREAIWYLQLATLQSPYSYQRWFDLATIYHLAGQPEKAREACAHALKLKPDFDRAKKLQEALEKDTQPTSATKKQSK
jgi:hypothetical protein